MNINELIEIVKSKIEAEIVMQDFKIKDKKNNTKKINLVLLKKIGSPVYKLQFNEKTINLFLKKELSK